MQLYAGTTRSFIEESNLRIVARKIGDAFYDYFRYRTSISELTSWQNSLSALAQQLRYAHLLDNGIVIEMQLPSSSQRLDCLIFGLSPRERIPSAVLIELKQWSEVQSSEFDGCVQAFVGGAVRKLLHPSLQAVQYAQYLEDSSEGFGLERGGAALFPCSWLHNMHPVAAGPLLSTEFESLLAKAPVFIQSDIDRFASHLKEHVSGGDGERTMEAAISARHAPSKKLLDYTARMIAGEPTYVLIDDQLVAFNAVLSMVRRAQHGKRKKNVVVVTGGPGTGKSLIALNLLGRLSAVSANVQHATGSKAFTSNIWRILGNRSKAQVKYFNNFTSTEPDAVDVILADEAHRIRSSSNSRFTARAARSQVPQIDELIRAAKTTVFFIDDHQAVRPGEVGSTAMIREAAIRFDARYEQIDLRTQFRCAGSDEYIDWVDQLLAIRKTAAMTLKASDFEFRMIDDPQTLQDAVTAQAATGCSARLMAGFCWPWSNPNSDGTLVPDVVIGDFRRPWNARPEARHLARGIPPAPYWATDPGGMSQVGCIYTAQGFEFDFAGIIWGNDLVIRDGVWAGQPSASRDTVVRRQVGAPFVDCVKNSYRVLMTRGMKGCFLYCVDRETSDFIKSRIA